MVAVLCRFADVDPQDDLYSLADERGRPSRLATHVINDPDLPPTVVIDSGNWMQVIWAVARQMVSDVVITQAEAETCAIENALDAGGTHNIDRLLRLPGTLNFPNARKKSRGRESHARA